MATKVVADMRPDVRLDDKVTAERTLFGNFKILIARLIGGDGVTGTFTTTDAKTVTVTNGIITRIV